MHSMQIGPCAYPAGMPGPVSMLTQIKLLLAENQMRIISCL